MARSSRFTPEDVLRGLQINSDLDRLREAMLPPKAIRDLQKMVDVASGASLRRALGIDDIQFGSSALQQMSASLELRKTLGSMLAATSLSEQLRTAAQLLGGSASKSILNFAKLNDGLRSILPPDVQPVWATQIQEALRASLPFFVETELQRDALLTKFDFGGAFTWLQPDEDRDESTLVEPVIHVAAVLEAHRPQAQRTIIFNATILCLGCDATLYAAADKVEMVGDTAGVTLRILPLCFDCNAKARQDPNYWIEVLDRSRRPRFRLEPIDGGGEGDGEAIGELWVVPDDGDDDEH